MTVVKSHSSSLKNTKSEFYYDKCPTSFNLNEIKPLSLTSVHHKYSCLMLAISIYKRKLSECFQDGIDVHIPWLIIKMQRENMSI